MLQRIHVECRDPKLQQSKYGKYHIIGDEKQSQLFELEFQDDFALTLRKLQFASGRSIKLKGRRIGQAIQTIRRLSDSDIQLLDEYCKTLKPFTE